MDRRGWTLQRRRPGRWLGGVAAGIGDQLGIDPTIVRVVLVTLVAFSVLPALLYLLLWLVVPEAEPSGPDQVDQPASTRAVETESSVLRPETLLACACLVLTLLLLASPLSRALLLGSGIAILIRPLVVAVVVWLVLTTLRRLLFRE